MAFTRKFLTDHGVPEDQVDAILAERNRTLKDYVLQSEVQTQIDAAVAEAQKNAPEPIDVKTSPEYLALLGEKSKLEAFSGTDFASVKAPYKDLIWDKLDHAEKHKPYAEQLTELQASMPDLFVATAGDKPTAPPVPSFGAAPQGAAPKGDATPTFGDFWGFGKK